jgi:hypothetical protein
VDDVRLFPFQDTPHDPEGMWIPDVYQLPRDFFPCWLTVLLTHPIEIPREKTVNGEAIGVLHGDWLPRVCGDHHDPNTLLD